MKKCAATALGELPVIYWGKKNPAGEEGSLERRCSNSQMRETLASKARSMRSSSRVMSDLVTHKAFPFKHSSLCASLSLWLLDCIASQPPLHDTTRLFL